MPPLQRFTGGYAALGLALLAGCASARPALPPSPPLPEVRFVPPCDPRAVVALTAEDEVHLKQRDRLLAHRIRELEAARAAEAQ